MPSRSARVRDGFNTWARGVARFTASPGATAVAGALVIVWALLGPACHFSETWQLVINTGTTIVTFLMVFVLNNAQAHDTGAINAKLDALIIAIATADNRAIAVEDQSASAASDILKAIRAAATPPPT